MAAGPVFVVLVFPVVLAMAAAAAALAIAVAASLVIAGLAIRNCSYKPYASLLLNPVCSRPRSPASSSSSSLYSSQSASCGKCRTKPPFNFPAPCDGILCTKSSANSSKSLLNA
ncbi:hypothetical protein QBC36DRAFT_330839 [Triangularia setosa]|uniref:Secreted peptide n=1 Tax=Triangularia setosa TaxID=2587417 RepID=A0AAN6W645_9PEZI|nr:hypothetical protein QBC36DRAFT_330839 [Podospora setosa]